MCHCKVCGHHINLGEDGKGYCPICDKEVRELDVVSTLWMDPIIQYCQDCGYSHIDYPFWIETREDLEGCRFDSGCIFGLENTQPTEDELKEFEERRDMEI